MQLSVKFPIPPYTIQEQFSKLLYEHLQKGTKLCLIESPTGTGKSYSLLVGLLSWLTKYKYATTKKENVSTAKLPSWIKKTNNQDEIYIEGEKKRVQQRLVQIKNSKISQSRVKPRISLKTEKQSTLDCDAQDQKRDLPNKSLPHHSLPKIVFTSRTHSQLTQIMASFKKLKTEMIGVAIASKKHLCINKQVKSKTNPELECAKILEKSGCPYYCKQSFGQFLTIDIDEAIGVGNKHCLCPYYSLKSVLDVADLICVPYASIMSKDVRTKIGIDIQNAIVVFDEGHNSRSIEISFQTVNDLLLLLKQYHLKYQNMIKSKNRCTLNQLIKLMEDTVKIMTSKHQRIKQSSEQNQTLSVSHFLLEFSSCEINIINIKKYVQESHLNYKIHSQEKSNNPYALLKFIQFFEQIIVYSDQNTKVIYKNSLTLKQMSLKIMVFSTVKLNQIISQSKMTVFAGGTLSPLESFKPLLDKYSNLCKQFDHIINNQQCQIYILEKHKQKTLTFTHSIKFSEEILRSMMQIIEKSLQVTKEGIVIFLQSYKFLQIVKQYIVEHSNFSGICIFDSQTNTKILSVYEARIRKKQQSILFSVMGGKLSEGINFSDQLARLLIVFGLPFPDTRSIQMQLKINYNQKEYVQNLCMRVVNQTIGRAIRHKGDWSKILLVDSRFNKMRNKLPKWMRNRATNISEMQQLIK